MQTVSAVDTNSAKGVEKASTVPVPVNTTNLSGVNNASNGTNSAANQAWQGAGNGVGGSSDPAAASSAASAGKPTPMLADPGFKLDPSTFSPSAKPYTAGSGNIANMIGDLVRLMLIAISTLAVISIAIGGAMMSVSGGNTDRVSKGKAIVIHSLQALAVSLSAYLIIKFVSWVIG